MISIWHSWPLWLMAALSDMIFPKCYNAELRHTARQYSWVLRKINNDLINRSIHHEWELFHIHKAEQTNTISIVLYGEQWIYLMYFLNVKWRITFMAIILFTLFINNIRNDCIEWVSNSRIYTWDVLLLVFVITCPVFIKSHSDGNRRHHRRARWYKFTFEHPSI